ncbi:TIGR04139 family peptide modification target [Pedobacter punctiformis]|uniref:TIGR04139 family peptide modification target n=1 Tax=Pedobacter punctiformis TaxID=3004097 RepID=A0ABT4LD69_9SPHI|nr:TIGR04139 family peptide modification target [Pedobacter sp. HCMS5-2]MCZ4245845.1 TIGR04139 family peptide modification target [Pedobacter sp. HCMS5-2]
MINLKGMQKSLSSLENKKLDLESSKAVLGGLAGGPKYIVSNLRDENGCQLVDYYYNGKWCARFSDCNNQYC